MFELKTLGKLNKEIIEREFGKIQTNNVIVTKERVNHIKERHLQDYELFKKYGKRSIEKPDYIIKDNKNIGTVFMVKKLPNTNLNVVVRVALDTDKRGYDNSVMTFYRMRKNNLDKLIAKNELLYKKE